VWGHSLLVPTKQTQCGGHDLRMAAFGKSSVLVGARNREEVLADELKLDDGV